MSISAAKSIFSSGAKAAGNTGVKTADEIPKPIAQGSQGADEAMAKWIKLAQAGKYSTTAINLGLKYLESGNGEANFMERPTGRTRRPVGDDRTAEEIIKDNPALANLGNQKDIKREELIKQCGDWTENNKDPESRANAAYNMAKVLNYIDNTQNRKGQERQNAGDGNIEGITKDGDARRGTEAGMLKDFAEQGYGSLPQSRQLDQTNDTHVRLDGSNKDNFQWFVGEVGKVFNKIPLLNIGVGPTLEAIGEGRNFWDSLGKGALAFGKGISEAALMCLGGPAGIAVGVVTNVATTTAENIYEIKTGKDFSGKEADHNGNVFT